MEQKKWKITISGKDGDKLIYRGVQAQDESQASTRAVALWFADNPKIPIETVEVEEEKGESPLDTTEINEKLDEILSQIQAIWRAIDRVNDTLTEVIEGTEDLGEITKEDIGPGDRP